MKKKQSYIVYSISIDGVTRYIGRTSRSIIVREKEHNKGIGDINTKKKFYQWCRDHNIKEVKLEVVSVFKTKLESKQYETLLILEDRFKDNNLIQKAPKITDF